MAGSVSLVKGDGAAKDGLGLEAAVQQEQDVTEPGADHGVFLVKADRPLQELLGLGAAFPGAERMAEFAARLCVPRVEADCRPQRGLSVHGTQGVAEQRVGPRVSRVQPDGGRQGGLGVGHAADFEQRVTEKGVGLRVGRVEAGRRPQDDLCLSPAVLVAQRLAVQRAGGSA